MSEALALAIFKLIIPYVLPWLSVQIRTMIRTGVDPTVYDWESSIARPLNDLEAEVDREGRP